ncbi:1,4-dihydroxy-2-naphthoate polyprenyltransferase [Fonticella tunisiensis]|uniref:1,4-dihydroxy-2-naphthoate octaprenyltransferase n=1 Tax=Fonticella tunisiensis TaxID=1096341 RepID=A0A4V3EV34_9CLOT|nr:1,4-dihydroxy-2-naphthoate polyprenyltransferase [Fonticella tunisiensis]TDT62744.1 1,4-dihydroxy-2-naphthoate octaprenyltransferase [Fonticella tunisiensis]
MSFRSFLKLVEIQTKIASVIPFLLGTFYSLYRYGKFRFENFIIMFISLLAFDMTTTAINNYIDFKKARKKEGYGYEKHNAIVRDNLRESTVLTTIYILLSIAIVFGIILTLRTNLVVLLIGVISFMVGIFYSFGPIPISRMPLGELFSGVFMGFIIMFLSIYIHVYDQNLITLTFQSGIINLSINIVEVFNIFLISIPAVVGIANIMLANNICDVEDDIVNGRHTLVYYIGKERALVLFKILYYIGYIDIAILLALKLVPTALLIVLLTFIPVRKNIGLFHSNPVKSETFVLSVKNFIMMNLSQIILIAIVVAFKGFM